jgi:3'-phosphoadenosine 5'-phosphosulfate sulfotransferase (PAPS reductase)/FAD synthetase
MRDKHPELPLEYCFADTGRELPDLYEFIKDLEKYLGKPIVRLTDWGRQFDYYLKRWNYFLPGYSSRWCTKHLKIRPFERYARGVTKKWGRRSKEPATVYIGIRADEDRVGNYGIEGITYKYPFRDDGIDKAKVFEILEQANIPLPDYYRWRSTGGCYMCPWQRPKDWYGLRENHPDLYQIAKDEEKKASESSGKPCSWSVRKLPLDDLISNMRYKPEILETNSWGDVFIDDDAPCVICAK